MLPTVVVAIAVLAFARGLGAQSAGRTLSVTLTHSVASSTSARTDTQCRFCAAPDLLAPVSVSTLELEWTFPVRATEGWGVDYHLRIVPLVIVRNNPTEAARPGAYGWFLSARTARASNLGLGTKPAGLRGWVHLGRVRAEADVSGGLLLFRHAILAANAAHLNFVGEAGVGLRLPWPNGGGASLGYQRHHVSNAGLADVNPGLNSHVIFLSVPVR